MPRALLSLAGEGFFSLCCAGGGCGFYAFIPIMAFGDWNGFDGFPICIFASCVCSVAVCMPRAATAFAGEGLFAVCCTAYRGCDGSVFTPLMAKRLAVWYRFWLRIWLRFLAELAFLLLHGRRGAGSCCYFCHLIIVGQRINRFCFDGFPISVCASCFIVILCCARAIFPCAGSDLFASCATGCWCGHNTFIPIVSKRGAAFFWLCVLSHFIADAAYLANHSRHRTGCLCTAVYISMLAGGRNGLCFDCFSGVIAASCIVRAVAFGARAVIIRTCIGLYACCAASGSRSFRAVIPLVSAGGDGLCFDCFSGVIGASCAVRAIAFGAGAVIICASVNDFPIFCTSGGLCRFSFFTPGMGGSKGNITRILACGACV